MKKRLRKNCPLKPIKNKPFTYGEDAKKTNGVNSKIEDFEKYIFDAIKGMTQVEVEEFLKEQKAAMKRFEVYEKDYQNSLESKAQRLWTIKSIGCSNGLSRRTAHQVQYNQISILQKVFCFTQGCCHVVIQCQSFILEPQGHSSQ